MFLTKVGLLQKERKQDDARLSAPGPGTGVWEQRWARARLPGCVPRERRTHPVIFGGLRFWYSCSSTVQTAPLTFSTRTKHLCRLRLWRTAFCGQNGQESSAARPSPRHPDPSSSSRSSSSPSPWVPVALGCPGHTRLVYGQMLCKATRGCCKCSLTPSAPRGFRS